jgi:hypothetical protein
MRGGVKKGGQKVSKTFILFILDVKMTKFDQKTCQKHEKYVTCRKLRDLAMSLLRLKMFKKSPKNPV